MNIFSCVSAFLCLSALLRASECYAGKFSGVDRDAENCPFNICNSTEGYPHDRIRDIVTRNQKYHHLFGYLVEIRDAGDGVGTIHDVAIGRSSRSVGSKRSSAPLAKDAACTSVESKYFPRRALNASKSWKVVVNVEEYEQEVLVEICRNAGETCAGTKANVGRCEQKYETRKILVVDEDGSLTMDTFSVPSGCFCSSTGS